MAEGVAELNIAPLVVSMARANHNWFHRRGQVRLTWDEINPVFREHALQAQTEMLSDGTIDLIVAAINDAKAEAPILRLRLLTFIDELRARPGTSAGLFADELLALINRPLED